MQIHPPNPARSHRRSAPALGWACCVLGLVAHSLWPQVSCAASASDFIVYSYDINQNFAGVDLPGRLHIPTSYDPANSYPLVIFYHGSGENGTDNLKQINSNIDNLLARAKSRQFFLYAPQASANWNLPPVEFSYFAVQRMVREYNINPARIYVTGLSNGAAASWRAISHFSHLTAGVVPICGGYTSGLPVIPSFLPGKPIWLYHAADDDATDVDGSRSAVQGIRAQEGKPAVSFPRASGSPHYLDTYAGYFEDENTLLRYTEYRSGGHGIWSRAYDENFLYDWLLSKTSSPTSLQPGETILLDFGRNRIGNADDQGSYAEDSLGRNWNGARNWQFRTLDILFPFAVTSGGRRTLVSVKLTSAFAGDDGFGVSAGALYDSNIAGDGWRTAGSATQAANFGAFEVAGLIPGAAYEIKVFGSNSEGWPPADRRTRYEINSQTRDINVKDNASQLAIFESVAADSEGRLNVKVYAPPGSAWVRGQINAMEIKRLSTYVTWASVALASVPQEHRGFIADPEHDGIPNLLEFALDLSPLTADTHLLPHATTVTKGDLTYLELLYTRRTDAAQSGLGYAVGVSRNMESWPVTEGGEPLAQELESNDNGDGTETVRVRCVYPVEETGAAFMRVRVAIAEP